ncbi:general odorant-binding protein 56a-like [Eupeodes corollae]|uniref:OBP28 n=1 Tax=Eupeodes corollae TaxID=290404 RepID=A0A8F9WKX8_9MUSC|nr:general odorant-binding protein 56a-like [Eupeodes corollae]QYL00051.1 OBP28 [Eupeodes corollae]
MKFLIVFALIAIVSVVSAADADVKEQNQRVEEHVTKCRSKHPIKDEQLALLKDGKVTEGSDDERCFVNCFMEESGIMVDGKIQKEKAIKAFSVRIGEEKAIEAFEKCQSEVGSAKCETALKMHNCFHAQGVY